MGKEMKNSITFMAEDTFSDLFWDEDGAGCGDCESFFINDDEFKLSSLKGLKEWFMQADKYDPFTDVSKFNTEGREEWINQRYKYAKQIREMIPKDIKLYYGFWHQFGDGKWIYCKACIYH